MQTICITSNQFWSSPSKLSYQSISGPINISLHHPITESRGSAHFHSGNTSGVTYRCYLAPVVGQPKKRTKFYPSTLTISQRSSPLSLPDFFDCSPIAFASHFSLTRQRFRLKTQLVGRCCEDYRSSLRKPDYFSLLEVPNCGVFRLLGLKTFYTCEPSFLKHHHPRKSAQSGALSRIPLSIRGEIQR